MAGYGRVFHTQYRYELPREASPHFHFGLGLPMEKIESRDILANGSIRATEAHKSHNLLANRANSNRRKVTRQDVQNLSDPVTANQNVAAIC